MTKGIPGKSGYAGSEDLSCLKINRSCREPYRTKSKSFLQVQGRSFGKYKVSTKKRSSVNIQFKSEKI